MYRSTFLLLVCLLAFGGCGGDSKKEKSKKSHRNSHSAKAKSKKSTENKNDQHEVDNLKEDKQIHVDEESIKAVSAEEALSRLKAGNKRFVSESFSAKDFKREREDLSKEQHPPAIVLACADSPVSPEALFNQSLGKLFVVRVAGNISNPIVLGSIEYAAAHLHSKLLVVLGHESCGAVKATLGGERFTPNTNLLITQIKASTNKAKAMESDEAHMLNAAIEENVRTQVNSAVRRSKLLAELIDKKEFQVVGGIYNARTGAVDFLPADAPEPKAVPQATKH